MFLQEISRSARDLMHVRRRALVFTAIPGKTRGRPARHLRTSVHASLHLFRQSG